MIKNEDIICVSSIDWDFIWQGHQEIMSTFAKNGNRVLFIENTGVRTLTFKDIPRLKKRFINWFKSIRGFKQQAENLFVYSPIFLPFPYSKIARCINKYMILSPLRRWMKVMEFHEPIIWTFLPTGIALDIINNLNKKLLVYYCIADFYQLVGNPKKVKKTEDELIKKSDLIFAQGKVLEEKCKQLNKNVHIFPFGVKIEVFDNFRHNLAIIPDDIKIMKKPIIGYVGGIHRHVDFNLIKFLAEKHPELQKVFSETRLHYSTLIAEKIIQIAQAQGESKLDARGGYAHLVAASSPAAAVEKNKKSKKRRSPHHRREKRIHRGGILLQED